MNKLDVRFGDVLPEEKGDVLVLPITNKGNFRVRDNAIIENYDELSLQARFNMESDKNFNGDVGQTFTFAAPKSSGYKKIVLMGIGDKKLTKDDLRTCGKALYNQVNSTGYESADILPPNCNMFKTPNPALISHLVDSMNASTYKFDKYFTDERSEAASLNKLNLIIPSVEKSIVENKYNELNAITEGEFLAADLANEPGNVIYPESVVERIYEEFEGLPVTIKILDDHDMMKENMNAALAVGQGSVNKPRMVVIEYDGTNGAQKDWPLALVGKGVTFDTGGISIKPSGGMEEMKMDMGGAAAVLGTMRAIAGRGANTKVVAICGFAENMPDGNAYRPGDIIKTRSGKTVNVGNTDAEGRLVLCDAMDYIQDKYKPKTMLDLATLTGAVLVSLAHTFSGVFTDSDKLWKKLKKSGNKSGQPAWQLPMHDDFAKAVKGKVADLENSARIRWAGSSTAAEFLKSFVKKSTKSWAHLDIAGTAIPADGISKGHGVRWMDQFIADNYEDKSAPKAKLTYFP